MIVGALASGRIRVQRRPRHERLLRALARAVPARASGCSRWRCARFLAATYLTVELGATRRCARTSAGARWRAAVAVGVAALLRLPARGRRRAARPRGAGDAPLELAVPRRSPAPAALTALAALATRRYRLARAAVGGADGADPARLGAGPVSRTWSSPTSRLHAAAASPRTQRLLLIALAAGVPVLVPSLLLLFRVFKRPRAGSGQSVRADRAP